MIGNRNPLKEIGIGYGVLAGLWELIKTYYIIREKREYGLNITKNHALFAVLPLPLDLLYLWLINNTQKRYHN